MSRKICKKCNEKFGSLNLKKDHDEDVHGVKMYYCDKLDEKTGEPCGFKCPKKYNLPGHIQKKHPVGEVYKYKYECDYKGCDKEYESVSALNDHKKKHDECYDAPTCNEGDCDNMSFNSKYGLLRHLWTQHGICHEDYVGEEFNCEHCTKGNYKRKDGYENHLMMAHDIGIIIPHPCPYCGHVFKKKSLLESHINDVHDDDAEVYYCIKCKYNTKRKHDLERHLWRVHKIGDGKIYTCDINKCSFNSPYKHSYLLHMWCRHDIGTGNTYRCKDCFYSSKRKHHYENHVGAVHDEGNKVCDYCLQKCFTRRTYKDKNKGNVDLCRNCYRKASKATFSRAEEQMVNTICNIPGLKEYIILQDRILSNDKCGTKRRPDLLLSSGDLHIFNECDEKEHKSYEPICE